MILEENNPDDLEYKKQLGLVGLELVTLSEMVDDQRGDASGVSSFRRYDRQKSRRSLVDYRGYDDDEIMAEQEQSMFSEERIIGSLVEQLRNTTIKVKLLNAMADLIYPLSERINAVALEIDAKNNLRQHETSMYLDRLLKAVDGLNGRQDANRGFYLAAKEFFRNPFLSIGRGIANLITASIKFGIGALFGFGDKKTDTDRIVDAINRQTEWHMTNQIDQSKGFFQRLKEQGVLGMSVRGVANAALRTIGVDKTRAQTIEDQRSQGIEVQSNGFFDKLKDSLSSRIYGDDITKKGRLGSQEERIMLVHDSKMYTLLERLTDTILTILSPTQQDKQEREVYGTREDDQCRCSGMVADSIERFKEQSTTLITTDSEQSRSVMVDLFNSQMDSLSELNRETIESHIEEKDRNTRKNVVEETRYENEQINNRRREKLDESVYELLAENRDGIYEVVKYTKQSVKEAKANRAQAFLGTLTGIGSKIIGAIGVVVAGIASAAGSIIAALWASSRARNGTNLPTPVGGADPRGTRSANLKLGLAGVATTGALALAGSQAEEGSKLEAGIGAAGSAAMGASLGAFAGPKGAIVGGLIGGLYGLYQNWETLFTTEREEEKSLFEKIQDKASESYTSLKETANSLVERTKERIEAGRDYVEQQYPEQYANAEQVASNLVERSRESVSIVKEAIENSQLPSVVEKLSNDVTNLAETTTNNVTPLVDSSKDRVVEIVQNVKSSETTQRVIDLTKEVKDSTVQGMNSVAEQVTAIQDRMTLSLDSMRDVFDSLKSQANKTLEVLSEHTTISKEIAASLKTIAVNTKQQPQPEGSPFADSTDDGLLKSLFGR